MTQDPKYQLGIFDSQPERTWSLPNLRRLPLLILILADLFLLLVFLRLWASEPTAKGSYILNSEVSFVVVDTKVLFNKRSPNYELTWRDVQKAYGLDVSLIRQTIIKNTRSISNRSGPKNGIPERLDEERFQELLDTPIKKSHGPIKVFLKITNSND